MIDYSVPILPMAVDLHMFVHGSYSMPEEKAKEIRDKLMERLDEWTPAPMHTVAFDGAVKLAVRIAINEFDQWEMHIHG